MLRKATEQDIQPLAALRAGAFGETPAAAEAWLREVAGLDNLLLVEREKMGSGLRKKLEEEGIVYAYIDDFYSGDGLALAQHALVQEINRRLSDIRLPFNLNAFLDEVLFTTGVHMSKSEKTQFYSRYLERLQVTISAEGNVTLNINPR